MKFKNSIVEKKKEKHLGQKESKSGSLAQNLFIQCVSPFPRIFIVNKCFRNFFADEEKKSWRKRGKKKRKTE